MTLAKLTFSAPGAIIPTMSGAKWFRDRLLMGAVAMALAGCITLEAPTEPIVIELNINITQEVVYRLAEDARENIEDNPEIF